MAFDPAALRRSFYLLLTAVSVGIAAAKNVGAENVYEPSRYKPPTETSFGSDRDKDSIPKRGWPKTRPEPTPTFSSNDKSRWATVRALVEEGTYVVGRRSNFQDKSGPWDDRGIVFTKGAPDVLLARCSRELVGDERRPLTEERRREILDTNEALAGQALRTLGVAGRWLTADALADHVAHPDARVEQDLVFAGLVGIIDPPRPEAKEAVARAKSAGIRPLMITGDHPVPAVIAQELGISRDGNALTGAQLDTL